MGCLYAADPAIEGEMGSRQPSCHVAIIGAGPYGLAAAAHLRAAGVETRAFGVPMEFWERRMPKGMFLRSGPSASEIGDPGNRLTLENYHAVQGTRRAKPVPIADFIGYGQWYQRHVVPDLDRRRVERVERDPKGFRLWLDDGEQLTAARVVVAAGLEPFAWRPPEFDGLPDGLTSHTSDENDFGRFAARRVIVLGGGQSALESAALLHEAGAVVEVIVRSPGIHWLKTRSKPDQASVIDNLAAAARKLLQPLARPPFDIMGPRLVSWLLAWPRGYRRAPARLQRLLTAAAVRPAGSSWLVPRLAEVPITTGRSIVAARAVNSHLHLRLSDGGEREVDHLLLGTGFRVDVRRYPFLSREIKYAMRVQDGYPELEPGFESSIPGLHFLGTPAARSFGPLCRFVVGTRYAGRSLARRIAARAPGEAGGPVSEVVPLELTGRASHAH